jgi:hypothetical protein
VKIAFQKPYSPSPSAGSLRTTVLETCSLDRRCTSMNRMKYLGGTTAEAAKSRCVGVFVALGLLLFLWRPHVYIGNTCLGLQRPVTD